MSAQKSNGPIKKSEPFERAVVKRCMKNNQDLFSDENFFSKEGSYTYQMVASGPSPSDEECQEAVKLALKARISFDKKSVVFQGLSALTHAAILFTALFFIPSLFAL